MNGMKKELLQKAVSGMEAICLQHYDKAAIDRNLCHNQVKYSRNQMDSKYQFLTAYLSVKRQRLPRLYHSLSFQEQNYTEYFFDGDCLQKKIVHDSLRTMMEYYYFYGANEKLRLGFQGNALREIHVCRYENGLLMQVDHACFSQFGKLHLLSDEIYTYSDSRLISCTHYEDYSPLYPMLMEKTIMGKQIVLNPSVTEFEFQYDENGVLRQYTMAPSQKNFPADAHAVKYVKYINTGTRIHVDQLLLW